MEAGYRTPLLDCFRRGEVPADIRMLAAKGALAPRALEQLALLVFLVTYPEPSIARVASRTIDQLPPPAVAKFIGRSDVPDDLRAFFAARGIAPIASNARAGDPQLDEPMIDDPQEDDAPVVEGVSEQNDERALVVLNALPVPQRLKLALRGTREQRALLIRDTNRIVAAAVLSSPRLNDTEVETFAKMANVSEDVLRTIGQSRAWTRSYAITSALVRNPKTPPAIAVPLLPRLNEREIRMLANDRNLPEAVRLAVRKMVSVSLTRKQ